MSCAASYETTPTHCGELLCETNPTVENFCEINKIVSSKPPTQIPPSVVAWELGQLSDSECWEVELDRGYSDGLTIQIQRVFSEQIFSLQKQELC